MIEPPTVVRIGPHLVQIVITNLDDQFGEAQIHPTPVIRIDRKLDQLQTALTLIHELIEMAGLLHHLELDEYQVRALEMTTGIIIHDNPALAAYVAKAINGPQSLQDRSE